MNEKMNIKKKKTGSQKCTRGTRILSANWWLLIPANGAHELVATDS